MLQTRQETIEVPRVVVRPPTPEDMEVSVWIIIWADARRVVNAMTITEYMDTWLYMPDAETFYCSADEATPDNFRIDIYNGEDMESRIQGYCLLSTPDHLMYVWRKTPCEGGRESVVDIHLQNAGNQCTLHLKHSGLCSMHESLWHSAMWKRSLENLCRLMEK